MILGQDLYLPFETPAPVCFNAYNTYSFFKLETDLPLPFEQLHMTKRKHFAKAGVSKYRSQRKPAVRVRAAVSPALSPSNRNSRRKANVLVQVDCSQTSALQCVRYIENKRIVFAKWTGTNQWSHHPVHPTCHISNRFVFPTMSQVHVPWSDQCANGAHGRGCPQPRPCHWANHARNQENVHKKALQKS